MRTLDNFISYKHVFEIIFIILRKTAMDSITLTLSGSSSILEAYFVPEIELDNRKSYVIGLVKFVSFNSAPNVDSTNNKLYVGGKEICIADGCFEIASLNKYLREEKALNIHITPNNSTLRCKVWCDKDIDFTKPNSINELLGFKPRVLRRNQTHESDSPVKISKINVIGIQCNIASGAYINDKLSHIVHEFAIDVEPGYLLSESPNNIIYLPITSQNSIQHIQCRIVDQNGNLVNFRGETITIRLHIKSV